MKMWNPLNYLGYGSSQSIPTQQLQSQSQIQKPQFSQAHKNIKLMQRYLIEQHANFHKRIKQFEQLIRGKSHNQEQNTRLVKIFSHLIHSLEEFMTTMSQVKKEYEENLVKIESYDTCQRKIQNHNNIVQNLIESHERDVETILAKSRQQQVLWQARVAALQHELQQKAVTLTQSKDEIDSLKQINDELTTTNQTLKSQIDKNKVLYTTIQSQLGLLLNTHDIIPNNKPYRATVINSNSTLSPTDNKINIPQVNIVNLSNILLAKSYIAQRIFAYLDVNSLLTLSQTNKPINYMISKNLPQVIYHRMLTRQQQQMETIKSQSIYYNHVLFDQLDSQNNKINAIKYLFFNHKPGTYILSMFQEDITKLQQDEMLVMSIGEDESSVGESSVVDQGKRSWKSFFKSDKAKINEIKPVEVIKSTGNISAQQKFSLAELKNSQTFKKVEHQLSKSFHQHVFSLKLPKDLESFGKLMTEQYLDLKKELSSFNGSNSSINLTIRQWTSKLLTLSKFLYLESQQLWGLGQSIFAKLMQFYQDNYKLRSQIEDLTQNQTGMRKLVQQLARNKIEMQKRIWESQRKNIFLKSSAQNIQKVNQKLEQEIQSIRLTLSQQETKTYDLQKQLSQCKQKLSNVYKKYKQKMEQFAQLKEQIAKISWI